MRAGFGLSRRSFDGYHAALMGDRFQELRLSACVTALRGCAMFADVPLGDLEKIAQSVQVRRAVRGEYLFHEGDPARGFFIVRKGAVNIHRVGADGAEKTIHIFREGNSFAEGTLGSEAGYPACARVVEDCDLLFVPRAEFLALLRSDAAIALRIIGSMSQHLRLLVNALEDIQGKDVETRLMNWLLKRCPLPRPAMPLEIALDVTKTVLAAELSTRSETLSRALAKLRDAGLIAVEGRRIRITSPQKLDAQFRANLGEGG
jgi:CRP/FNR family transcriptional regulator, dissimilatory nitrate respiration regulator